MSILRAALATTTALAVICVSAQPGIYAKPRPAVPAQAATAAPTPISAPAPKETKIDATIALSGFPGGLAVFARNGALWLVGAGDDPAAQPKLSGPSQKDLGRFERVSATGGTAFKLAVPATALPAVTRTTAGWQIALTNGPAKSAPVADATLSDDTGVTALTLALPGSGKPIAFTDGESGDMLLVVPSPAGTGYGAARHFAEFELLPTVQGAVIYPLADGVAVTADVDNVTVAMPKGLKLSDPADRPIFAGAPAAQAVAAAPRDERILLDWSGWKLPAAKPQEVREDLEHRAAVAPEKDRARLMLDLARTIFANGRAPEALGYLGLALSIDPDFEARDDIRMLRGAASALLGRPAQADADLTRPSISETRDGNLWRGFDDAQSGKWSQASAEFHGALDRLSAYPDGLYRPLALAAIEAALESNDSTTAKRLMDELRQRPAAVAAAGVAMDYFTGRIALADGNKDAAAESWKKATSSRDQYYRTRAQLASIQLGLDTKKLEPKDAVEQLDRLRFAWRGDDFENKVLNTLGATALSAEDYETAQTGYRQILALSGTGPAADDAKKNLAAIFRTLFIDGAADKLPPLRALALFNTMQDLAPGGPDGDKALDRLAERMVQMDLLTQAADVIETEAGHQTVADVKSQLGARAAALRLLDEKPELALRVLDGTESDSVAPDLKTNRRLLRVRALSKQGRADDALKLLGVDEEPAADQLRVDIGWVGQKWRIAADALARLTGQPPASGQVDDAKAALIVRRALALNLLQDIPGLAALRRDFAPCLAGTKSAAPFEVLTRPGGDGALANQTIIRSAIAEVDLFKDFLGSYRAPAGAPRPGGA